jgi:chaperonin GroES
VRPLNNQIFIRPILMQEKASATSGLYIPENTRERSQEAEVVAVGPGDYAYGQRMPIDLEKGDRVLFLRRGYTAVINGESLMVVGDRDILAVLDDDENAEFFGESIDAAVQREALGAGF